MSAIAAQSCSRAAGADDGMRTWLDRRGRQVALGPLWLPDGAEGAAGSTGFAKFRSIGAMNMLGLDNPVHILFLLMLLLLVFGAKRLPEIGRSLGSGMRGFKDALTNEPQRAQGPPLGVNQGAAGVDQGQALASAPERQQ